MTSPGSESTRSPLLMVCAMLFVSVLLTFLPALRNGFIQFDDQVYVTENPHVQQGLTWAGFAWAFRATTAVNWHPLAWLSHMLDWECYGASPAGHHFTSVLLHSINAVLLLLLLRQLTGSLWRSAFVSALFALHPLRVESVAWVAERKDVLSTFFGLLALMAYARSKVPTPGSKACRGSSVEGRESTSTSDGHVQARSTLDARRSTTACPVVLFALALMSKPMLVTLPFVMVLLDFWPLRRVAPSASPIRTWFLLVLEKWPFWLLSAASCAVTYFIQESGGAMQDLAPMGISARVDNAIVSYWRYLGKIFCPTKLSVVYPVVDHWPLAVVALAAFGLMAVSIAVVLLRRREPFLFTGWFWFVGTLVPVVGIVAIGNQSMADRYSYLPSIGITLILVWSAAGICAGRRGLRIAMSFLGACALAANVVLTQENIANWRDSETLFRHALAVTKDNTVVGIDLATWLMQQGRVEEAIKEFQAVAVLKPRDANVHNNLGALLAAQGKLREALRELRVAQELDPRDPRNRFNLGRVLEQGGNYDSSIVEFRESIRLDPYNPAAWIGLGQVVMAKSGPDAALPIYKEAVRTNPGSALCHNGLGTVLAQKGRIDDAVAEFEQAIRLDPSDPTARQNLELARKLKSR